MRNRVSSTSATENLGSIGDLPSHFLGKDDGVNRLGSFLGVIRQGSVMSGVEGKLNLDPGDQLTAFRFGQRIAEATQRWQTVE